MFLLISGLLILVFGFVVFVGAPYLPTRRAQAEAALDLLDLKAGQVFYDLGCGDGRLLRVAAQRGWRCVGYELNPLLVLVALVVNWRYRKLVKLRLGNFWMASLDDADGVFVFLLDKYMPRLDKKLAGLKQPVKLASYTFQIPSKKAASRSGPVFLYKYPGARLIR